MKIPFHYYPPLLVTFISGGMFLYHLKEQPEPGYRWLYGQIDETAFGVFFVAGLIWLIVTYLLDRE